MAKGGVYAAENSDAPKIFFYFENGVRHFCGPIFGASKRGTVGV